MEFKQREHWSLDSAFQSARVCCGIVASTRTHESSPAERLGRAEREAADLLRYVYNLTGTPVEPCLKF